MTRFFPAATAVLCLCWASASNAFATSAEILLAQAAQFERKADWDKACEQYEAYFRQHRLTPEIRQRYHQSLRRLWQVRRLQDPSYRKEVLTLDYGQALRLYGVVRDSLLDYSLETKKVQPADLFEQGVNELDACLGEASFCQQFLPGVKPSEVRAFRTLLRNHWRCDPKATRADIAKYVREIALTAQHHLQLSSAVVIAEFTCGACYAFDNYTFYLTPSQLQELCDSLKSDAGSVHYEMKSESVGYLHILGFQESTPQEVDAGLAALGQAGMKSLILDLRGNGGGAFEAAIEVARRFLSVGVIASTKHQDPKFNAVYHAKNPAAVTVPMILLIDGDTASAAELLAGALKDNARAKLIGQTSFGKGCSQCILKLPNAVGGVPTGGLRVTVAKFYSPKGQCYSDQGVLPDVFLEPEVTLTMDTMAMGTAAMPFDSALAAALTALR